MQAAQTAYKNDKYFYFNLKDKNDIFKISALLIDTLSGFIPNQNQIDCYYCVNPAVLGVLPFVLSEKSFCQ